MCGIAGYMHLDGRPADAATLRAMLDAIVHRGPDGEGMLVEGSTAIGMRRLAIIDVRGGDQPIHTEDKNASIVFNGEVYNYGPIRDGLIARGHVLKTTSDTETVVHLYEEKDTACTEPLRGMFGFAIYDRRKRRLFIVRDRIGKKPIHYFFDGATFIFGSEIKSVLVGMARLGKKRPEVLPDAIVRYMGYGYIADPLTAFRGIMKLPPASHLVLENGGIRIERYWNLSYAEGPKRSEAECFAEMERILEDSVRMRMISEVPLGAYLSGGVDSSTTVGLMARLSNRPVKTFTIGFEDADFDEMRHARKVAEHLRTDHHEFVVKPDAASLIKDLVRHFDEPFADSSAIPTYYVSKMAREHVTVVLSGDGGDELFAGYSRYRKTEAGALARLPAFLRKAVFGGMAGLLPIGAWGRSTLFSLAADEDARYVHHVTTCVSEWHRALFSPEFARTVTTTDPSSVMLDVLSRHGAFDATTRRMAADFHLYLPADVMAKVDRTSMMVSLEARAPLLDHVFAEFAAGLPLTMKTRNGEQKYLLKKLARKLVPPEVIDRPKQGFAVPIAKWFNAEWMEEADELLVGARARARGIFAPATIDRFRREHRDGRRDHSHFLWSLMMLELWFREYVDGNAFGR